MIPRYVSITKWEIHSPQRVDAIIQTLVFGFDNLDNFDFPHDVLTNSIREYVFIKLTNEN